MDVKDLITPADIIPDLAAKDKRRLIEALAARAAEALELDPLAVAAALQAREELGSTGMGEGIAIPHARLAGVARPFALFARLKGPIAFDAVDERPVDLVCLLLLPTAVGGEQLGALACVARRLRTRTSSPDCARRRRAPRRCTRCWSAREPGRDDVGPSGRRLPPARSIARPRSPGTVNAVAGRGEARLRDCTPFPRRPMSSGTTAGLMT